MNFAWKDADPSAKQLFQAIATIFERDERLMSFFFEKERPRMRMRAGLLREEAWRLSEEEQLLIRVALDIWSGSGHVQIWELLEEWDQAQWETFAAAMRELPPR